MKLSQISAGDDITGMVVNAMLERSTVLQYAEFYRMHGNAEYARKTATASGGQFRVLDSDFPENSVSPVFANPALKILGDYVQIDQAHERRGYDLVSVRASELLHFAQNLGKQFQYFFFNGDGSGNTEEFTGLKRLISGSQLITAAQNGLSIDTGNSDAAKIKQQKFLELLETLIESVDGGAQVIFMDGKTLSRLTSIAREFFTTSANAFGQPVKYFNGIPVLPAGYDRTGNRIISHAEQCGNSSTCTSIYAMRFGERADLTIASNTGVEVKDLGLVGSFYTHRVELDAVPVLLNDKAAARIEGIIVA